MGNVGAAQAMRLAPPQTPGATDVTVRGNENRRADLEVFLPGLSGGDLAASPLNPVLYSL